MGDADRHSFLSISTYENTTQERQGQLGRYGDGFGNTWNRRERKLTEKLDYWL